MADALPRDPLDWLQAEYDARRMKNPRYSLRAFAQLLGVRSGRLSEFLSGRRRLTPDACSRMASRLGLSPTEADKFVVSLRKTKGANKRVGQPTSFEELSEDVFTQISEWYHLALLNILHLEGQAHEPAALAKRLGLNVAVAKRALRTFEKLGLIARDGDRFVRTAKPITTSKDAPSQAIKKYHSQMLEKAQDALFNVPTPERDFSASMLCVNASTMKKVKELIEKSRRQIGELSSKTDCDRLYALTIQFFPLSQEPH